jgi:predicted enzyme related to lactoylglutathione lyase
MASFSIGPSTRCRGRIRRWRSSPQGVPIGTLRGAEGKISGFNGVVYIQVADIQASCGKAKELGGSVVPGFPFDLPDGIGAICLILDPSGHPMGMYSRTLIKK